MVRRKRHSVEEHGEDWEDSVSSNSKQGKVASSPADNKEDEHNSATCSFLPKGVHQYKIAAMAESVTNKNLAMFILSNNIEFDVVEAPFFVDFVRGVAEFGSGYKLPSPLMLQRKAMPEVELEIEEYVKKVRQSWVVKGCTIMLGLWKKFMSIIAYSAEGAEFLKLQEIPKSQKSKLDLEDIVSSVIEDIGVDHIVQVITNSDRIYKSIENKPLSRHSQIFRIRCVAHEIHSLLKAIYNEVGWVQETIDNARFLVKCMHEDGIILSKVKYPCKSKFASNYQMLQSILSSKNELQQEAAFWKFNPQQNNKRTAKITNIIVNGNFWSRVPEVLNAMEPLIRVLCLVEDDRPTLGYLYEALEKARERFERQCCKDRTKYGKILTLFQEWRSNKIIHPIHAAAAFLNPAYMCRDSFEFNVEMKTGIDFMLSTMVISQEKENFIEDMMLYKAKTSKMFNALAYQLMKVSHPCAWWDTAGVYHPVLKKYAIRILSQPCKCSCDIKPSAFEVAQRNIMNKAVSITQDNSAYTIMNAKIMEKFGSSEEQILTPIDLDNCNELPDYADPQQSRWDDQMELISENTDDDDDDDDDDQMDIFHLDGKPKDYTGRPCRDKARRRWRKSVIVICTSIYLGLPRKIWSNNPGLAQPFITDSMIKVSHVCSAMTRAQRRWTKILSVVKWLFIYLEARKR